MTAWSLTGKIEDAGTPDESKEMDFGDDLGCHWADKQWNPHRSYGPALVNYGGRAEWWWHGKWIDCENQEQFERWKKLKAFW